MIAFNLIVDCMRYTHLYQPFVSAMEMHTEHQRYQELFSTKRMEWSQRTREIQLETIIFLILNASKYSLSPSALPCMICGT